ncbi:hypothetical protein N2152v2_002462 [Parachlorella kessleri]
MYDWLWLVDADTLAMTPSVPLTDYIDERFDMVLTRDCNGINTGSWLIRNSQWTEAMLAAIYARPDAEPKVWWEQAALIQLAGGESDDPYAGLNWVQQNAAEIRRQSEIEQLEKEQAQSVGLYVRGRAPTAQVEVNEDDPERFLWHKRLAQLGPQGDFAKAEAVLQEMARAGHPPGPRAYHALVFTYLKGNSVEGALDAICREVKAGIQPLPQSYAAVVQGYVQRGDTSMAEAVWASNRRSGVDCGPSWLVLTSALFRVGQEERGMQLLEQGESEQRVGDAGIYAQVIAYLCRMGDVEAAMKRLNEMKEKGVGKRPEHFSPIIEFLASAPNLQSMQEAESVTQQALATPSLYLTRGTLNKLLRGYLSLHLPAEELGAKVSLCQEWARQSDVSEDLETHVLLLEAFLQTGDLQAALLHWGYIRSSTSTDKYDLLQHDTIIKLIQELSNAELPLELYGVLGMLYSANAEHRPPATVFQGGIDDATGCSHIAVWFHRRLKEDRLLRSGGDGETGGDQGAPAEAGEAGQEGEEGRSFVFMDGVRLDASSLRIVTERGGPVALSKVTVREIRAELTARRQPLYGNKKELIKRLQKARARMEEGGEGESKAEPTGVPQEVTETHVEGGRLVSEYKQTIYLPVNAEGVVDDSRLFRPGGKSLFGGEGEDEEEEEDEETSSRRRRRRRGGDDDDDYDDDEDEVGGSGLDGYSFMDLYNSTPVRGQQPGATLVEVTFATAPKFTNASAGLPEMVHMHQAATQLGALPTQQDLVDLVTACIAQQDPMAAARTVDLLRTVHTADPAAAAEAAGAGQEEQLLLLVEPLLQRLEKSEQAGRLSEDDGPLLRELRALGMGGGRPAAGALMPAGGQDDEEGVDEDWRELYAEFDML